MEWCVLIDADETPEIPCCDVKKTSTGSQRTLAAALYLLNCPPPEHQPAGSSATSTPCHPVEKQMPGINYDFSHRAKEVRLLKPWQRCGYRDETKLVGCVSRAQTLVRFNDARNAAGVPDLRRSTRTGKRHEFADNIHSQVLRGSTIAAN